MPNNFFVSLQPCPVCGAAPLMFEFGYGALAGEEYGPGENLRFEEEYSFFDCTRGERGMTAEVAVEATCDECVAELRGILEIRAGVTVGVTDVAIAVEGERS